MKLTLVVVLHIWYSQNMMGKQLNEPSTIETAEQIRILIGKLSRRLREQVNIADLSWSQVTVLGRLDREGPATVTSLARNERIRPQSMSATIASLEESRLVQASPDPADGRQNILSITDEGRELVRATRAAREDWLLRAIQTQLDPYEQETLADAIPLLKRISES